MKNEGIYVNGLKMQGARWCRLKGKIQESIPKIMFDKLPMIWLKPINKIESDKNIVFNCPVYKTTTRRNNYVFTVKVPSDEDESHWILRGKILLK